MSKQLKIKVIFVSILCLFFFIGKNYIGVLNTINIPKRSVSSSITSGHHNSVISSSSSRSQTIYELLNEVDEEENENETHLESYFFLLFKAYLNKTALTKELSLSAQAITNLPYKSPLYILLEVFRL